MNGVTQILSQIESGDPKASEQLLPLVYDELRKLAAQRLTWEKPGQTLLEAHGEPLSTESVHIGPLALTALYTAWDRAEPGKSCDVKAREWLRTLMATFARLDAIAAPARRGDSASDNGELKETE
jgi:hypothetical protein